ncbi:MAG: TIGR01440 family protein [Defluviitaleaceae bacterium]|nr:TIGR01440 family protein [Defluviitaleaceae bacterium]
MIDELEAQVGAAFEELAEAAKLQSGQIVVLGTSTSEVLGEKIGKAGSVDVGYAIAFAALEAARRRGLYLAVQGCEHINRALCVEAECAKAYGLEIVGVAPTAKAGGACVAEAHRLMKQAVMVEHIAAHAGLDIGDTSIGMHIKFVQAVFRPTLRRVGKANVTCLYYRPKLVGGERASYL